MPNSEERNIKGNNIFRDISADCVVGVLVVVFMAAVSMSVAVLCLLWVVLIAAVLHIVYKIFLVGRTMRIKIAACFLVVVVMSFPAYSAVLAKITADAVREEEEGARINIEGVQFAEVGKSDATFPFFNLYYANNGRLTAKKAKRRFAVKFSSKLLTKSDQDAIFKDLESNTSQFVNVGDIPQGNSAHFSEPSERGEEQIQVEKAVRATQVGSGVLYLFEVHEYEDELTSRGKVRVSEFCVYFGRDMETQHICLQNELEVRDKK